MKGEKKMGKTLAVVLFEDDREEAKRAAKIITETSDVGLYGVSWDTLLDASIFFGKAMHLQHVDAIKGESDLELFKRACAGYPLGILTDLFMPVNPGDKETDAVGVAIAVAAKTAGLPVVVCTSAGHRNLHWAESILNILGIPVVRTEISERGEDWEKKDWKKAIEILKKEANV